MSTTGNPYQAWPDTPVEITDSTQPVIGAHCAVRTGSVAVMTGAEATDALWDALRLERCSTGLKAHRIIMLHKHDIAAALKRLTPSNTP